MTVRDTGLESGPTEDFTGNGRPQWTTVADALRDEIAAGRFPPGTRLPSERELAEEFAVSRATVVSALNVLRGESLIDSRHRAGSWVRRRQ